jgi:citrate lyase subunit beta/citryl-CoA lyase
VLQALGPDAEAAFAMKMRSLLFVPGDSERKLARAADVPADVLIIDLEDSVAATGKAAARALTAEYLAGLDEAVRGRAWVRINDLASPEANADLSAVMRHGPRGIVLPKCGGAAEVESLGHRLGSYEAEHELTVGATAILPVATETPASVFTLGGYAGCSPRLAGLTWGAEDLGAAVGASRVRDGAGGWTEPYRMVRALCLFAAHAAGVEAIDTLHADFRDQGGLARSCEQARRDGFGGKLAIHPDQVGTINRAFTPSAEEVDHARRVVAAFEAQPGAGVLQLDGRMLDRPHLVQARKILEKSTD